jgi:hypothetical protein
MSKNCADRFRLWLEQGGFQPGNRIWAVIHHTHDDGVRGGIEAASS